MLTVGSVLAHSVTVEAVTVTVETVVVMGAAVMVDLITMIGTGATTVDVAFTVVVEGVMERQEQAEEISDEGKAEM